MRGSAALPYRLQNGRGPDVSEEALGADRRGDLGGSLTPFTVWLPTGVEQQRSTSRRRPWAGSMPGGGHIQNDDAVDLRCGPSQLVDPLAVLAEPAALKQPAI
jgi:hypothetical protein